MRKPISPDMHAMVDYSTVLMTAAAPRLLGMSDRATRAAEMLAGGYLALSLVTDYDLSLRRLVPFKAHGAAEAVLGMALPFLPKVLGFERDRSARAFFAGLTALTAVVAGLTDWDGDTHRLEDGESFAEALISEEFEDADSMVDELVGV
ncbi:MAG TPA: hypothetical protein VFQ39_11430 [Longimicrobium sp.]|nr:hypothetical protein [Longimicrobium sp.]